MKVSILVEHCSVNKMFICCFKLPSYVDRKSGLISYEFYEAGVYHYSDHNFQAAAEYVGTIIVKPKQTDHWIELSKEGFTPGMPSVSKSRLHYMYI